MSASFVPFREPKSGRWFYLDRGFCKPWPPPASTSTGVDARRPAPHNDQRHTTAGTSPPVSQMEPTPRSLDSQFSTMSLSADVSRPFHNATSTSAFARTPQVFSTQSLPYSGQLMQTTLPYAHSAIGSPPQHAANSTVAGAMGSENTKLSPPSGRRYSSIGSNGAQDQASRGSESGKLLQLPQLPQLDPTYKVHPPRFFVKGRVLKTLWTEAAGQPRPPTGQWSQSSALLSQNKDIYAVAYGEYAFSKVKRFIVMAEGDRSCTAIAISTHGGQGAKRMGRGISQHGIVYTGAAPPPTSSDEAGMQPDSVRINTDNRNDELDASSRLHYGKFYTIEYNVRVKAYGMVHDLSLAPLMRQFKAVNVGRLGFLDPPLQTHHEESTPAPKSDARNQVSRRSSDAVDKRQFLSSQHQQAMARHASIPSTGTTVASASRTSVQSVTQRRGKAAVSGPSRSARTPSAPAQDPPRAVLVGMGFDEAQIQLVYELVAASASPRYAIARVRAIKEGYSERYANMIALRVDAGEDYIISVKAVRAIISASQERARATTAAQAATAANDGDDGEDDDDENDNADDSDEDDDSDNADADDDDDEE